MVQRKYNTLEVSRGIAACLVVAVHTSALIEQHLGKRPFGGVFDSGWAGVDFFFVLSGFIITFVHTGDIGRADRFKPFLWKRFIRIFPPYWVVLFLVILGRLLFPSFGQSHSLAPIVLVKSIVLWPASIDENILSVAWTLSYELLFYAVFSLAILNRRMGLFLFVLWQLAVLAANVVGDPTAFTLQFINLEFLFGAATAKVPTRSYGKWAVPVGVTLFVAAALALSQDASTAEAKCRTLVLAFGSALVIYGLKCWEEEGVKVNRLLLTLGTASYSIYLVHYPAIAMVGRVLRSANTAQAEIAFVGIAAAGCFAGIIFHSVVEAPIMGGLRRLVLEKTG